MAFDSTILPKDPKALARIIETHAARENGRLGIKKMFWWIAYWYYRGVRQFDRVDPVSGDVTPYPLDGEGHVPYQSQELVSQTDKVLARMNALDVRPRVTRHGVALAGLRERASGQVILDAVSAPDELDLRKKDANLTCAIYGTVGVTGRLTDHPTIGLTTDYEVIHPRELLAFPTLGLDRGKQRGLLRQRVVQWDRLKDIIGPKRIGKMERDLDVWEQSPSASLEDSVDRPSSEGVSWGLGGIGKMGMPGVVGTPDTAGNGPGDSRDENIRVVRLRELWLTGVRGTVTRYVIASRDAILHDEDLEGTETYCPISLARFIDIGDFYGLGVFDLLFGTVRELERLEQALWKNTRTMDRYGVLMLPHGLVNERSAMREIGFGLRHLAFTQNAVMSEDSKPFVIQPANSGTLPGQVSQMARQALASISPVPDLAAEKGRIDSFAALQFLDDRLNQPTTNPIAHVATMWGGVHKSVLQQATREVAISPRPLPVSRLTLDLAGVVIDMRRGTVEFPRNPIPILSQLSVTIESLSPNNPSTIKMELMEWLKAGVTDPQAIRLYLLKHGIDTAMWMDDDWNAYESCVIDLLTLYGDGETPGRIVGTPYTIKPDIQIRITSAFLASVSVKYASPLVKNSLKRYREFLLFSMGLMLPNAVPLPEDEAAFAAQLPPPVSGGGQQALPAPQPQEA